MPSEITITFDRVPIPTEAIVFRELVNTDPVFGDVLEIFVPFRLILKAVTISGVLQTQTVLFSQAFAADYNALSDFSFSFPSSNQITITHLNQENYFDNTRIVGTWGSFVFSSTSPDPKPVANLLEFVSGTDPCTQLRPVITYDQSLDLIEVKSLNGSTLEAVSNPANPFTSSVDLTRGTGAGIFVTATIGTNTTNNNIEVPSSINIESIDQRFTPNGYVVTIMPSNLAIIGATLEYSNDNTTWQLSNQFSGLLPGTYTFYIRDQYGCVKQQDFTLVDDGSTVGAVDPFFEISELNSFHLALQETDKEFENYTNTLSWQEEDNIGCRRFEHLVKKSDSITTQFKSSYSNNEASIVDDSGNVTSLTVAVKTQNINIFDVRDGLITDVGDGIGGVYFNGGSRYNPNDNTVIGDNPLFLEIPSFYEIGEFVKLDDLGWYQITDIIFLESKNSFVAVTNYKTVPFATDVSKIMTYNYNQREYEAYEFNIDFSLLEGNYFVCLDIFNDGQTPISYASEWVNVQESHPKTFEIKYSNTENNEIIYSTGIVNFLRIPYIRQKYPRNEKAIDVNRTDTQITHLEAEITDKFVFDFRPVPNAMVLKLSRALSLDEVFIDGVGYIFEDDYEIEVLGQTNYHRFTAIGTPNNKQFNTRSNSQLLENIKTIDSAKSSGGFAEVVSDEGFIKLAP